MELPRVDAVGAALRRLGWTVRDLWVASFAYGSVGDEHDVALHVATGDHLGPSERAVVVATINDALLDHGEVFPVPLG
jgi:hypothetical protein